MEGFLADGDRLEILLERPAPDLPQRLAHPALVVRGAGSDNDTPGCGPFRPGPFSGILERNPHYLRVALLDSVELANDVGQDPVALAALGQIDLAVVYGRDAARIRKDGHVLTPVPRRAPVYALWLNPSAGRRWTRDPAFREWLDEHLDREGMVRYLFSGLGEPVSGLLSADGADTPDATPSPWSVPRGIHPRLTLSFDVDDPDIAAVAARVKAEIEQEGVVIELDGVSASELAERLHDQDVHAALVAYRPLTPDPVLGLQEFFTSFGTGAEDVVEVLRQAGLESPGSESRLRAAQRAEQLLTVDGGCLIPLVRVFGWAFVSPRLADAIGGDPRDIDLERAWWMP